MKLNRTSSNRVCAELHSIGDCFERVNATFGIGPPALQIGDCISVPAGATGLLLLQPNTEGVVNRYKLVGECHPHGMMYGQALGSDEPQR